MSRRDPRQNRRIAAASAVAAAFKPSSLPSPLIYLDSAPANVSLDGSNNVQAWANLFATASTCTQGTAASRPAYNASDAKLGGKPSVSSIGTSTGLAVALSSGILTGACSVYIVCYWGTASGNNIVLTDSSSALFVYTTTGNPVVGARPGTTAVGTANTTNAHVICWQPAATAGTGSLFIDNSQTAAGTIAGTTTGSFTSFFFLSNTTVASPGNAAAGALLIYGARHTALQRQALFGFLGPEFGIATS